MIKRFLIFPDRFIQIYGPSKRKSFKRNMMDLLPVSGRAPTRRAPNTIGTQRDYANFGCSSYKIVASFVLDLHSNKIQSICQE